MEHVGGRNESVRDSLLALVTMGEGDSMTDFVDLKKDLKKSLKKIAKEVGLSKEQAGELRLAHIRDGGREADIWDGASSGLAGDGVR